MYRTCPNPEVGLGVVSSQIMEKSHDTEIWEGSWTGFVENRNPGSCLVVVIHIRDHRNGQRLEISQSHLPGGSVV